MKLKTLVITLTHYATVITLMRKHQISELISMIKCKKKEKRKKRKSFFNYFSNMITPLDAWK